jgi:hypothetical protein
MFAYKTCSTINKTDLDLIFSLHPLLAEKEEERAFALWLIKGRIMIDPGSGRAIIPHELLHSFTSSKRTGAFLKRFQKVFPGFAYQNYWAEEKQCRSIKDMGMEPELREILRHAPSDERFSLRTLKRIRPYQEKQVWRKEKAEAKEQQWRYPDQQMIADYLHRRQLQPFLTMREEHFTEAWHLALDRNDGGSQLRALHSWYEDPFPRYYPTGKTPRVFGTSAQFLAKEIRQALFAGCHELDLQNCQLAIVAGLLNIGSLQQRMKTGIPIWPELLDFLGIAEESHKHAKPAVKTALYSMVYGMEAKAVEACLTRDLHAEGVTATRKLLDHPLMGELAEALVYAKGQIVKNGGMMSAYGWMAWDGSDLNSFLSIVIQSYETAIIAACYEIANREEETEHYRFTIVLHQHDGVTIKLAPGVTLDRILHLLQQKIEQRAYQYNIITTITA